MVLAKQGDDRIVTSLARLLQSRSTQGICQLHPINTWPFSTCAASRYQAWQKTLLGCVQPSVINVYEILGLIVPFCEYELWTSGQQAHCLGRVRNLALVEQERRRW